MSKKDFEFPEHSSLDELFSWLSERDEFESIVCEKSNLPACVGDVYFQINLMGGGSVTYSSVSEKEHAGILFWIQDAAQEYTSKDDPNKTIMDFTNAFMTKDFH